MSDHFTWTDAAKLYAKAAEEAFAGGHKALGIVLITRGAQCVQIARPLDTKEPA